MATTKRRSSKSVIKKKPKRKKSRKQSSSVFLSTVWKALLWVLLVTIVFMFVLYLFDYLYPEKGKEHTRVEQTQSIPEPGVTLSDKQPATVAAPTKPRTSPETVTSHSLTYPANAEQPQTSTKQKEQIIHYQAYTVSFNSEYKIANWVAWELTNEEAISNANERSNKFTPDPELKGHTAELEDYRHSGYDRGHLIPAADVKWSEQAMRESFYFSNICPQAPRLNQGIWKELEELCRLWAIDHESLLIVAGPVIEADLPRIGIHDVAIPRRFFKVVSTISDNRYQGIAFLMENKDYGTTSLRALAIPIDSVEKVTGIDFFPALPDEMENEMEAVIHWAVWSF